MWGIKRKNRSGPSQRLENQVLRAFGDGHEVHSAEHITTPIIVASPHSGRHYPEAFLNQVNLPLSSLRLGEDAFIDQLLDPLRGRNVSTIHAKFPRCFVDVNRGPDEIPPEFLAETDPRRHHITPRARSGLGVVPRAVAQNLHIYDYDVPPDHVQERLDRFYHPYHESLQMLLQRALDACGRTLLIDCHSMPARSPSGEKRPDIILGDRFGKSCLGETILALETGFKRLGYSVSRNQPYAGGYVTRHYGRPAAQVETIQIEINKALYLDPIRFEPHDGMKKLVSDFETIVLDLISRYHSYQDIAAQ